MKRMLILPLLALIFIASVIAFTLPQSPAAVTIINPYRYASVATEPDILVFNWLASTSSTTGATSYATSSYTPTANALVLATVVNSKASSPDTPTFSGNGLTWVQISTSTYNTIASPNQRITVFRAMGASPTATAGTADFAGNTQTGCCISISEFQNADTTGTNGSGAIVQAPSPNISDSTATDPNISYSAISNAANSGFFAFGDDINDTGSTIPPSLWTEIEELAYATPSTGLTTYYANNVTGTSVSTGASTTGTFAAIFLEIKPTTKPVGTIRATQLVDLNGQTDTSTLTTTILNNGTRGTVNTFSLQPATPTGYTVDASFSTRLNDIKVGASTYTPSNASHAFKIDDSPTTTLYWQCNPSGSASQNRVHRVSMGGFIKMGQTADTNNKIYDLFTLAESGLGYGPYMQLQAGNGGANYYLNIEQYNGTTTHSSSITVVKDTVYWVCFLFDLDNSITKLNVYNTSGGSVGSVTLATAGYSAGNYINVLRVGDAESNGSAGTFSYFEEIWINTAGAFPFGP